MKRLTVKIMRYPYLLLFVIILGMGGAFFYGGHDVNSQTGDQSQTREHPVLPQESMLPQMVSEKDDSNQGLPVSSICVRSESKVLLDTQPRPSFHAFQVAVARTDQEKARGLMFVTHMPDDQGMLFVFDDDALRNFWMKNTYIPLDILFVSSDGIIRFIHTNAQPHSRALISSIYPVRYVLEVNGGLTGRLDIKSGDVVLFDACDHHYNPL